MASCLTTCRGATDAQERMVNSLGETLSDIDKMSPKNVEGWNVEQEGLAPDRASFFEASLQNDPRRWVRLGLGAPSCSPAALGAAGPRGRQDAWRRGVASPAPVLNFKSPTTRPPALRPPSPGSLASLTTPARPSRSAS